MPGKAATNSRVRNRRVRSRSAGQWRLAYSLADRIKSDLIRSAKEYAKRHWPALRLRTLLFLTLLFVAALPGIGAVFLRVYENTLVQQTEAELIAQGAALAATAQSLWPGSVVL